MIVALIPVKRLASAKSRLALHMSATARRTLVLTMLERTVAAARDSGLVAEIAVTTAENELMAGLEVELLPDEGDLNRSLHAGVSWAEERGATGVLILPADLPLIRFVDVELLLRSAAPPPSITIVETQDGGTGALLLTPANVIPPAFGRGSFRRHIAQAQSLGVRTSCPSIPGMAFDLDTAQDLNALTVLTDACMQ
ncbi:MAG: 2-phospho-L-lactate guanylyltransferase [Chloroflexota bacterium]